MDQSLRKLLDLYRKATDGTATPSEEFEFQSEISMRSYTVEEVLKELKELDQNT